MQGGLLSPKYPELFFGIAGPIGIDMDAITRTLSDVLAGVAYRSTLIKITDEIKDISSSVENKSTGRGFYNTMRHKMAHASAICREKNDPSYLMKLAVLAIRRARTDFLNSTNTLKTQDDEEKSVVTDASDEPNPLYYFDHQDEYEPAYRSAYIIRQIKRPDEVVLLRQVYGKAFVLISAYGSEDDRVSILSEKIKFDDGGVESAAKQSYFASKLVEYDADEGDDKFGQHTRDAFHLADVVIDGIDKDLMKAQIERFIHSLFGANDIAPTKDEFGMNAAFSASLRSSDLSRQVGAAVFSKDGEILTQGCNEVPRAFGGTYWDCEQPDFRDIKVGRDSNDILKIDVLTDLVKRLKRSGVLNREVSKLGSPSQIVNVLIGRQSAPEEYKRVSGSLKAAKILDLTEYGRVVHAEMNSICDAARLGVSVRDARLFSTTFPCHNCTKHIIASGISSVVYLEPYPKSKARELHSNEIDIEHTSDTKVSFVPFLGITPVRYKDLFTKSKRKRDGQAVRWHHGAPAPMVDIVTPESMRLEDYLAEVLSGGEASTDTRADETAVDIKSSTPDDTTGSYDPDTP